MFRLFIKRRNFCWLFLNIIQQPDSKICKFTSSYCDQSNEKNITKFYHDIAKTFESRRPACSRFMKM